MIACLLLALCQLPVPLCWDVPSEERLQADLQRFECRWQAGQLAELADEHARWAESVAPLNADRDWWPEYVREAYTRWRCWHYLVNAQNGSTGFLIDLRLEIGEEAYAAGWMPAPMPFLDDVWR